MIGPQLFLPFTPRKYLRDCPNFLGPPAVYFASALAFDHFQPSSPPKTKMTLDTLTNGHFPSPISPKRPVSSGCVVQKYGGTSVGKFAREIVANVIKPSLAKGKVAVVCSAVSATVKADGTTNR